MKAIKRYLNVFKGVSIPWILFISVLALSFIQSRVEVNAVSLTADIIDASRNAIDTELLIRYVTYTLSIGALYVAIAYIQNVACEKVNLGVRVKLWRKLMRLPAEYYDRDNGNELVTRVTTDASSASYYFSLVIDAAATIYAAVIMFKQLFAFEASLAAWALIVIPFCIAFSILYGTVLYVAGVRTRSTLAATMGYLSERVRNFRLIRAFGMEQAEEKKGQNYFWKQFKVDMFVNLAGVLQTFGMELTACICIVISFVAGGRMVADGSLSVGTLVGFYSLCVAAASRIGGLYLYFGSFMNYNGILQKIARIIEAPEETTTGIDFDVETQDIQVDKVSFSYQDSSILKDVCCTIPKGKVTAIIGTNGAGKSTLLKLLERLYEPSEGQVSYGGRNIAEFRPDSWRKSIAFVTQEKPLMSGTVRENILYGVERETSEDELIQAARMANAYDFIMATPGGFDAQVGPDGSNFSGGQQQCIAIARAIMRNPDYLLLDEATSNLDADSEKQVSEALGRLMKDRTTVMVAHKHSAARAADHIVIMRNGSVEAEGSPADLMQSSPYYRAFLKI